MAGNRYEIDYVARFRAEGVDALVSEFESKLAKVGASARAGASPETVQGGLRSEQVGADRQLQLLGLSDQELKQGRARITAATKKFIDDLAAVTGGGVQALTRAQINRIASDPNYAANTVIPTDRSAAAAQTRSALDGVPDDEASREQLIIARKRETAEVNKILAGSEEYRQALAEEAIATNNLRVVDAKVLSAKQVLASAIAAEISENQLGAASAGAKGNSPAYAASVANLEAAQNELAQVQNAARAASSRYVDSVIGLEQSSNELKATLAATKAVDDGYVSSLTSLAVGTNQLEAALAEEKASSRAYVDSTVRLAAARDQLASAEANGKLNDSAYLAGRGERVAGQRRLATAEQGAALDATTPGDTAAAAALTIRKRRIAVEESLLVEQGLNENVYNAATARLAAIRQERALKEQIANSGQNIGLEAQAGIASERRRAQLALERESQISGGLGGGAAFNAEQASAASAQKIRAAEIKALTEQDLSASDAFIQATIAATVAQRKRSEEINFGARATAAGQIRGADETAAAFEQRVGSTVLETESLEAKQARINADLANAKAGQALVQEEAQAVFALEQYKAALQAETNILREQAGLPLNNRYNPNPGAGPAGAGGNPSLYQRLTGRLSGRDPESVPSLGSRFSTTAGFAVSGFAFYGAISGIGKAVKESEELQKSLAVTESMLESTGQGGKFDGVRKDMIDTAKAVGADLSETIDLTNQLAAAFSKIGTGAPDFERGSAEAATALKAGKVLGIDPKEATNELVAISKSFAQGGEQLPFEKILDSASGVSQRFGVSSSELVKFAADLAPIAQQAGFTSDQLIKLGGATAAISGRPVAVLSEQFSRVFATVQEKAVDLGEIFRRSFGSDNPLTKGLNDALGSGDIEKVFTKLAEGYAKLGPNAQAQLVETIGGGRNAGTVAALLQNSPAYLREVSKPPSDDEGKFEERWAKYSDTLRSNIDKMKTALEEFGVELLNAGVIDALVEVAKAARAIISVLGGVASVFAQVNEKTHGLAINVLLLVSALKVLRSTNLAGAGAGILSSITGGAGGGGLLSGARAAGTNFFQPNGVSNPGTAGIPLAPGFIQGGGLANVSRFARVNNSPILSAIATGPAGAAEAGIGTGIAGGFSAAAPLIALALGVKVTEWAAAWGAKAAAEREKANAFVEKQVKAGLSDAEIAGKIDEKFSGKASFGDDYRNLVGGVAKGIFTLDPNALKGAFVPVQQQRNSAAQDELQRDQFRRVANVPNQFISGQSKNADANLDRAVKLFQKNTKLTTLGLSLPQLNEDDFSAGAELQKDPKALREQIEKVAKDYKNDRTDDGKAAAFERLRTALRGDAELRALLDRLAGKTAVAQADDLKQLDDVLQSAGESVEQAQAEYAIDPTKGKELLAALQGQLATAQAQKGKGKGGDFNLKQLKAVADSQKAVQAAFLSQIQDPAELRTFAASFNTDTQEASLAGAVAQARAIQVRLQGLNSDGGKVDQASVTEAAQNVLNAQRAQLQGMIDGADTTSEKIKIAATGLSTDLKSRRAIIRAGIDQSNGATELVASYADTMGVTLGEAKTALISDIIKFGTDFTSVKVGIIDAKIESAKALQKALEEGGLTAGEAKTYNALNNSIAALENQKALIGQVGSQIPKYDVGDKVKLDPAAEDALKKQNEADARQEAKALSEAQASLDRARANGDPLETAYIELSLAKQALAQVLADPAHKPSEVVAAQARIDEAENGIAASQADIGAARIEVLAAQSSRNPVTAAQAGIQAAAQAASQAHGVAAQLRAKAQQISAQNGFVDAMNEVFNSRIALIQAVAAAAGDDVGAARAGVDLARQRLAQAQANGAGEAEINGLKADLVSQQASLRDSAFNKKLGDIDYLLEMEKISTKQAVAMLVALQKVPTNTEEMKRTLERKIKELTDGLSGNLQFNLPSEIKVPTLYEAKRALGIGQMGTGSSYQDNRNIAIQLYTSTDAQTNAAADRIIDVLTSSPRSGLYARSY